MSVEKAEQVLAWLARAERPDGGIAGWFGPKWERAYPEVTGYLIPTFFDWGEWDLALRCAAWLADVQNADGSWCGLDGKRYTFDTAAALEGLMAAQRRVKRESFEHAIQRAKEWLMAQILENGTLRRMPDATDSHMYTMRASAILWEAGVMRQDLAAKTWMELRNWGRVFRPHYAAYCLEGLWRAGEYAWVRLQLERSRIGIRNQRLFPMKVNFDWSIADDEIDVCATAQFGWLYTRAGMFYEDILETLSELAGPDGLPQGGIRPAWAAKYYLDLVLYHEETQNH